MIATLAAMPAKRRILVAGEMLELGPGPPQLHRECGQAAADAASTWSSACADAQQIVEGAREAGAMAIFRRVTRGGRRMAEAELREGDAVLLKASRGVGLEQRYSERPEAVRRSFGLTGAGPARCRLGSRE